jgi:glycerate kinase
MNAELVSGVETVMECCNLKAELESADWVVTGEGSFDQQSLSGKVVSGIIEAALESDAQVAVIAGRVNIPQSRWQQAGIKTAVATAPPDMPQTEAMRDSRKLLQLTAQKFARQYLDT